MQLANEAINLLDLMTKILLTICRKTLVSEMIIYKISICYFSLLVKSAPNPSTLFAAIPFGQGTISFLSSVFISCL